MTQVAREKKQFGPKSNVIEAVSEINYSVLDLDT